MISVRVPRPLRFSEPEEMTPLSFFGKAVFLPFTPVVNGLAAIVATQSLQFGAVSANSAVRSILVVDFHHDIVVVAVATIAVVPQFWTSSKVADPDASQKHDAIVGNSKNSKYQNIPVISSKVQISERIWKATVV